MVKLLISLLLLFNVINLSYSSKDVISDKIKKFDETLLEVKDPVTREIVRIISSTVKLNDLSLELGDNEKYVKNKPFVEERIRQNLKMIELLTTQINDQFLPFVTQDFSDSKSKKENMVESQIPIQRASWDFFPPERPWPKPPPRQPWKPPKYED